MAHNKKKRDKMKIHNPRGEKTGGRISKNRGINTVIRPYQTRKEVGLIITKP